MTIKATQVSTWYSITVGKLLREEWEVWMTASGPLPPALHVPGPQLGRRVLGGRRCRLCCCYCCCSCVRLCGGGGGAGAGCWVRGGLGADGRVARSEVLLLGQPPDLGDVVVVVVVVIYSLGGGAL